MVIRLDYTPEYQGLVHNCGMFEIARRVAHQKGLDILFNDLKAAEHAFEEAGLLGNDIAKVYSEMVRLHCAGKALIG